MFALIEIQSIFHPEYDLYATKLDEKPQKYFILADPDSYVLEAILNPGKYVPINSPEDTQIDDMEMIYGTNNVEFNSNYYEVGLIVGDAFPPAGLPLIIWASLIFSATSILTICLIEMTRHLKKMKKSKTTWK